MAPQAHSVLRSHSQAPLAATTNSVVPDMPPVLKAYDPSEVRFHARLLLFQLELEQELDVQ